MPLVRKRLHLIQVSDLDNADKAAMRARSRLIFALVTLLPVLAGCLAHKVRQGKSVALSEARRGFSTVLLPRRGARKPIEKAPVGIFQTIKYNAAIGDLQAYLSPDPGDGNKHAAIIWIAGGDCNSIGDVWSPASRKNDQTAAAFREAGVVMMFPSLRGGNDNPGREEGFFGEVNDVLSAAAYLEQQDYVDPKRIYLGGHSTGGTLALLVAECSSQFRCVFSFGPVHDVSRYGPNASFLPIDLSEQKEVELRSPGYWLDSIHTPVWIIEGTGGNIAALRAMARESSNPEIHFIQIHSADHFSTLAPTNELIARKILRDTGPASNISLTEDEVNRNFDETRP